MKKFFTIFSIFFFLLFSINVITTVAQPRSFPEGFYNIKDLGLMENVTYNVQNTSNQRGFLIVFDSDQKIQQAISLEPQSSKYPLKPITYDNRVVILGKGQLTFTS